VHHRARGHAGITTNTKRTFRYNETVHPVSPNVRVP
jgi:hypothetical protein